MGRMKLGRLTVLIAFAAAGTGAVPTGPEATTEPVGRGGPNRTVLPVNQIITPLGRQVELPGLRPQALALSPDERYADAYVVDATTGRRRTPWRRR